MNNYLAQHPDIFMAEKELHYFGSDLRMKERITQDEYLNKFQNAGDEKLIGEASVWYLFSKNAAKELKEFSPDSKIIIMLRDPVEMLHSLHSQHLFNANEDVKDFEKAISLDTERRKGNKLPDSLDYLELPLYRDTAMFAEQVKRYLTIFGKENVRIILYEEFKENTAKAVNETIAFLGLKEDSSIKFELINPNKKIRFLKLHRLLKYPSARLKKVIRIVLPVKKLRHELMVLLFKTTTLETKRKKMDEKLNNELKISFSDDIKKLGKLINRDLSKWMTKNN